MAKTKSTNTASIVEEKNSTVETTETPVVEEKKEPEKVVKADETAKKETAADKNTKKIGDNDKVVIKYAAYAGKSIIIPSGKITLDENGKCEVTGADAKFLLGIPGYELAK